LQLAVDTKGEAEVSSDIAFFRPRASVSFKLPSVVSTALSKMSALNCDVIIDNHVIKHYDFYMYFIVFSALY
jgi:hypothetical protein